MGNHSRYFSKRKGSRNNPRSGLFDSFKPRTCHTNYTLFISASHGLDTPRSSSRLRRGKPDELRGVDNPDSLK